MKDIVLYVEDNNDNIRLVERILRLRPDLDLIIATTGEQGLRLAHSATPTLILLDRRLPDLLGDEVLRQLKTSAATATIPVVMLSGDSAQERSTDIRLTGADEFLAKPFEVPQFLAVVDRYCPHRAP
jgi:DNA-binding response OmpR family regulator